MKRLIILLLIVGCEETGSLTTNPLVDDGASIQDTTIINIIQDTIIFQQDTIIINIIQDTIIFQQDTTIINIVQDTTIFNYDTQCLK